MEKVHAKIDGDVMKDLHHYRVTKLGHKATISDTIRKLLKGETNES